MRENSHNNLRKKIGKRQQTYCIRYDRPPFYNDTLKEKYNLFGEMIQYFMDFIYICNRNTSPMKRNAISLIFLSTPNGQL